MKILFVTNFFPPTHTAGTENYTYGIARGLIEAGHEVQIVCAGQWNEGRQHWNGYSDDTYNGVPVRRLHLNWIKAPDPNRYLYDNPVIAAHLRDFLSEIQPDVVHVTSCYTLSASVIWIAKEANLPVVMTLTDFWFLCPRLSLLRSDGELCDGRTSAWECLRCMLWETKTYHMLTRMLPHTIVENLLSRASRHPYLTRWRGLRGMALDMMHRKRFLQDTLALVDHVIAPSLFLKDMFLRNDLQVSIQVLPHGHDLSWLQSYTRKIPSAAIRFGYIGQISPIKGVHILVEAFKAVTTNNSINASLLIFGDLNKLPSFTEHLYRIASDHSNIHFNGAFSHEHLGEVLAQLDVLVVPSLWYENSPLVIQEAFATKTPVIATNLGGMSEFVQHEVNGLLFERGNVDDLAHQLWRVINEPGLLERLRAGIPAVKQVEEEVEELIAIYQELLCRETGQKNG